MIRIATALLCSVALTATAAQADTVLNTSLQNINTGTATTTTGANGTTTTVTGAGGAVNRVSGTYGTGNWYQTEVGGGATVGITKNYARSGNGSAYFSTTGDDSKADLHYYLAANNVVPLSSLTSLSYDFYRDGSSTANAILAPVLRLDILKTTTVGGAEVTAPAGSLIFENVYQDNANAPTNTWTTANLNLDDGKFWTNNSILGPTFAGAGGTKTLEDWINDNSDGTLSVYGFSIGVGSGWSGTFTGAVDNVSFNFANGPSKSFNFEVAGGAVPEPATWGLMILGFGAIGGSLRYRRRTTAALA